MKLTLDAVQRRKFDSLDKEMKDRVYDAVREWGGSVVAKIRTVIAQKFHHIPRKDYRSGSLSSSVRQDVRKGTGDTVCTVYFRSRTDRGVWFGKFLEEGATFSIPDIYARMRLRGLTRNRDWRTGRFIKPQEAWTQHTKAHSVTIRPHPFMGPTIAASEADGLASIQRVLDQVANRG